MTNVERRALDVRGRRAGWMPLAPVAPALVAALVLMLLPDRATAPLKRAAASVLAPGQRLAVGARQWAVRRIELFQRRLASAEEQLATADEIAGLRRRNSELETALAIAFAREPSPVKMPGETQTKDEPLVRADLVRARLLGPQARSFLVRLEVLDVGSSQRLQLGAPIFAAASRFSDGAPILDQGRNAGLDVDDLALAGRSIAGKLVDVGSQTATMQRLTEPGYRDLVQLARTSDDRLRIGPKGVLEGTGEKLCRISMIEIAEPVSPGDLVLAAAAGTGDFPAIYGRVTRAERQPGDAHWQIWMAPAIGAELPGEVDILRLRLNSERVADASQRAAP